jgi:PAS domain S-box-containing protein
MTRFATLLDSFATTLRDSTADAVPALLELTDDAIIVWELDGEGIVFWNRAATELYGYSPDEARGRITHELLKTKVPSSSVRELETILSQRSIWVGELRHTTRDGRELSVESRIALFSHRNGKWLVLETNRAIREQREPEETLRHADQERSNSVAQPMNATASFATACAASRLVNLLHSPEREASAPAARVQSVTRLATRWKSVARAYWEKTRMPLAWHGLSSVILSALPILKFDVLWWDLPHGELLVFAVFAISYLASAFAVHLLVRTYGLNAFVRAATMTLAVFSLSLIALLLSREQVSRFLLLTMVAASVVLVPLSIALPAKRRLAMAGLAMATLVLTGVAALKVNASISSSTAVADSLVKSAFYSMRAVSHSGLVPQPATRGGGLAILGEDVLLGTGDGHLYLLRLAPETDVLSIEELPTRVPANREEFAATFGGSAHAPRYSSDYVTSGTPRVQTWRFRIADVITHQRNDQLQIIASHHFWKSEEQCFVVRVSVLNARATSLAASVREATWRTLYESTPCIPITGEYRNRGKNPFKGEEIGGRLALLDERTLLLTLGDHDFSGITSIQTLAQDPAASYGKTIRIDLKTGASESFTLGHRNPQGLYVAQDGRIWLTEHGPQGGDELNLLSAHANYGWPSVTYGTDYGSFAWPLNPQQGRHANYTHPIHAWLPSIGVSNLIMLQKGKFPIWNGDLLIGSLANQSLYRVVLEGDRVVLNEVIPIGKRIRDLIELSDGRIMLWTDDAALVTLEPASAKTGAMLFATLCSGCHQMTDGMSHRLGPDLHGVFDRRIASAPGYDEYSPGLKTMSGRWTKAKLHAFLRHPQDVVPGTTMSFAGIADDTQRYAIIEYLRGN